MKNKTQPIGPLFSFQTSAKSKPAKVNQGKLSQIKVKNLCRLPNKFRA